MRWDEFLLLWDLLPFSHEKNADSISKKDGLQVLDRTGRA
jgi:hypothetical protein